MKRIYVAAVIIAIIAVGAIASLYYYGVIGRPKVVTISWGTSRVGSSGYRALLAIAHLLTKEIPGYEFFAVPTAGAAMSTKTYCKGELDGCYVACIQFEELYAFKGRFEGFEAEAKRMPVQTFWAYTLEIGIAIHDRDVGKYTKWSDLDGERIFTLPLGWDVGALCRAGLDALGIKYEHVELDLGMVGTALEKGDIVATGVYTAGMGRSIAPWESEMELTTKLAILNPSADEIERLKAAGFHVVEIDPSKAFKTDVNVDKMYGLVLYYGFHLGTEVPEDIVYQMLKVLEEHAEELAKYDPMFKQLAEDFVGMQVRGIERVPHIPVHPGLAKFLKEKGVWREEWKIAAP